MKMIPSSIFQKQFFIGNFYSAIGYNKISVRIVGGTKKIRGIIGKFVVQGQFSELTYVKDNKDDMFYWGRRGASCHLSPQIKGQNIQYYYSQLTVPKDYDHSGSYYMANGFKQGYFGIQINSQTQRRVLFSVWSGYNAEDPKEIPIEWKVVLNKSGPGVKIDQFGGQGSGGQSYLIFNWTTGQTYRFLIKATPLVTNATTFTAWFGDPNNQTDQGWRLIAQWTRPKVQTYLTNIYSFLECFHADSGDETRIAYYGNQWFYDQTENWKQAIKSQFTKDSTGNLNMRRDVQGGIYLDNLFLLKHNGFFNTTTSQYASFTRKANKIPPSINFQKLP